MCLCIFIYLFWLHRHKDPCSLQNLSSPTRDQTMLPAVEAQSLNHWMAREVPWLSILTRLLCLWNSPGKNTGVGCHVLRQGIFLTRGLNPRLFHLLHWQIGSLPLAPPRRPRSLVGISWRRDWLPTPVFLPGEFHRQRSLVGYSPWGHKEVRHD